jgi:murein peptide amidase A
MTPALQHAHNYHHLIARWRCVARAAGVPLRALAKAGSYTVYFLDYRPANASADCNGLYATAGIHGDEAGTTEGLLLWAERYLPAISKPRGKAKKTLPFFLAPCLNPWGLVNNRREAADGTDLNRVFDRDSHPPVGALKKVLAGRRFDLALTLHEDYDANGLYLYETSERRRDDLGETLLAAARASGFPIDTRGTVETRRFTKPGLVRMRRRTALAKIDIYPEAIWLYLNHTRQALTIETPSEFSLIARAQMQARLIAVCVERLFISRGRCGRH